MLSRGVLWEGNSLAVSVAVRWWFYQRGWRFTASARCHVLIGRRSDESGCTKRPSAFSLTTALMTALALAPHRGLPPRTHKHALQMSLTSGLCPVLYFALGSARGPRTGTRVLWPLSHDEAHGWSVVCTTVALGHGAPGGCRRALSHTKGDVRWERGARVDCHVGPAGLWNPRPLQRSSTPLVQASEKAQHEIRGVERSEFRSAARSSALEQNSGIRRSACGPSLRSSQHVSPSCVASVAPLAPSAANSNLTLPNLPRCG